METIPQEYRTWPVIDREDFYSQQRHDAPEEYGTVVTYRDPETGTIVKEQRCVQPHDWIDPVGPTIYPAGEIVTAWIAG